jgi:hypothetical protein
VLFCNDGMHCRVLLYAEVCWKSASTCVAVNDVPLLNTSVSTVADPPPTPPIMPSCPPHQRRPARVFQHETDHTEGRLYDDEGAGRCSRLLSTADFEKEHDV